ncbi:MAG: aspartate dehydrogenase [Lachnospiraceae bacterium]|nr:aspartate dehydrogenase [Lachnospiraceae bacterium]
MFGKKHQKEEFDKTGKHAVIHASICNGERVAGFKDDKSGKFEEIMLIRNDKDLDAFMEEYDVSVVTKEW